MSRILGYIAMRADPFEEGVNPIARSGSDRSPLLVFNTRAEADQWAREYGIPIPHIEIFALDLTPED
jgi:hypothetical protein